eukprot:3471610-Alexandrium_andersonii.AAC.1
MPRPGSGTSCAGAGSERASRSTGALTTPRGRTDSLSRCLDFAPHARCAWCCLRCSHIQCRSPPPQVSAA